MDEELVRRQVKLELRKRMRGLRNTTPAAACAARSAKIVTRLLELGPIMKAKSAALFWPIEDKHEVDLRPLDAALRARGVHIAYPSIDADDGSMTFRFAQPEELEERGFGFAEPSHDAGEAGVLDVIVVPAIAIDPRGHRIGYGAGYYDRALPRFAPPAVTVGVAYEFQLLIEVPAFETDIAVDWVVTDVRTLEAEGVSAAAKPTRP
jgi:5-formyltetrahydrofolate cyclo-ligase